MPTEYQRQSVVDLECRLYSRPLHPELFTIYAGRTVQCQGLDVRLWLVDSGHVVGFSHKRGCLTETAGSRSEAAPNGGLLNVLAFRGERTQEFRRPGGVKYTVSMQVEQLSPPHYARVHEELLDYDRDSLFFSFADLTRSRPAPFSYIDYQVKRGELLVQAFHAFPDELTIIRTQSLFEIARI